MKDFRIEMLFAYSVDDGTQYLGWYHGTVRKVMNEKTNCVRIEWDRDCLGEQNVNISDHKLVVGNWNPKRGDERWLEGVLD